MENKLAVNTDLLLEECRAGKIGNYQLPITDLCIALTNRCNLYCKICPFCFKEYENKTYNNEEPFMTSLEEYKAILDATCATELEFGGTKKRKSMEPINIHYTHGESLLNTDIVNIVKYTKSVLPNAKIRISSNGTISPYKLNNVQDLLKDIDKICFSIDGINKETFEEIRVPANFEKVMKNLYEWAEVNKQIPDKIVFRLTMALSQRNISELEGLVKLASNLENFDEIYLQPLVVEDSSKELQEWKLETLDTQAGKVYIERAQDIAKEHNIMLNIHSSIKEMFLEKKGISENKSQDINITRYCNYLKSGILEVNNRGQVKEICCNMSPKDNQHLMRAYNIPSNVSPFAIYNSEAYWKLREDLIDGKLESYCAKCIYCKKDYENARNREYIDYRKCITSSNEELMLLRAESKVNNTRVEKLSEMLSNRNNMIENRDRQIKLNEEMIENRDNQIANRQETIQKYEKKLATQEEMIGNRDIKITNQKEMISKYEQRLIAQQEMIENRNNRITNHEKTIGNYEEKLSKQEIMINNRNNIISNRDKEIEVKYQQIEEYKSDIYKLKEQIKSMKQLVGTYEVTNIQLINKVRLLEDELTQKDKLLNKNWIVKKLTKEK